MRLEGLQVVMTHVMKITNQMVVKFETRTEHIRPIYFDSTHKLQQIVQITLKVPNWNRLVILG